MFLAMRLAEKLDLSDQKTLALSRIFRDADERRQKLLDERHGVEEKIQKALAASSPDEAALGKLVGEAADIDHKLATGMEDTFRDVAKQLTVAEQAKLVLARPEIRGEVHGAMLRRMHGGFGPHRRPDADDEPRRPAPRGHDEDSEADDDADQ
jgi:hypothetical protein